MKYTYSKHHFQVYGSIVLISSFTTPGNGHHHPSLQNSRLFHLPSADSCLSRQQQKLGDLPRGVDLHIEDKLVQRF